MQWKYEDFIRNIDSLTDIDLMYYKERQMKRRINSLIARNDYRGYESYYRALIDDAKLLEEFISYITINVSEFFRNPKQWEVLEKKILPILTQRHTKLKIWSAACSTGEEPYSLAMLLDKYMLLGRVEILATDLDRDVLNRAKSGIYSSKDVDSLSREYRDKYFIQGNDENSYTIERKIRNAVMFKEHDLLKDPYPKGCHLIICRNVMIYFTEEAKAKLYRQFYESLHDEGVFFVGSTEQIILPQRYNFSPIETFFYEKIK